MEIDKISIIIPVYQTDINQLKECLDSVLCQDQNYIEEVLVIDDGSNENYKVDLKKLVKDVINQGLNVSLIESPSNKGLPDTRKLGYQLSKGNIIVFVDSDDIIVNKNFCKEISQSFQENPKIQLIRFKHIRFKNSKKITKIIAKNKKLEGAPREFIYDNQTLMDSGTWFAVWQFAFRRNIFESCKELFENIQKRPFEDIYFLFILASNEFHGLQLNKIYYGYRFPNKNSILWNLKKSEGKEKFHFIYHVHDWLTRFEKYNLNDPKIYELWIMICISHIVQFGYSKMAKTVKDFPSKEQVYQFLEKYKFRENNKLFHLLLKLNLKYKFFDVMIPFAISIVLFFKIW